ncbi:MAG: putative protease [Marinobacter excellens HL-55]|uniref:Putative protease n=1 Tax=Marinobacter excellens HL-55 TaxID=1305731 RepID=A0A0N8KKV8_9GAMM|nr:MAG: putative protease [Marinobacter excellens HL-55]
MDAIILADMGLLDYAANKYPETPRHLSVQGSATSHEALSFYKDNFDIRRAVLPRVLSIDQVRSVAKQSPVELEVLAFGSLCIMAEGRCYLSSYLTDESPNTRGACSPAKAVRWQETPQGLESRQRSPAYIADVARTWRQALDRLDATPGMFSVESQWNNTLAGLSEGGLTTIGAYHRKWK